MSEQIELMQPAIDRIEIKLARESVSLRHAAMRVLGRMLNFIEEDRLSGIARMVDNRHLQLPDVEKAFNSWATSAGAKSFRYFLAIVDNMAESRRVTSAARRPFTPPKQEPPNQKFFGDEREAEQFTSFLIDQDVPSREFRADGRICIHAPNAQALYLTFLKTRMPDHV